MNLFGIFLIVFLIYIFFKGKKGKLTDLYLDVFSLTLVVNTFINLGYFLKIKDTYVLYSDFLIAILFCFSVYILLTKGKINKQFYYGAFFLLSILMGILLCVCFPIKFDVLSPLLSWDNFIAGVVNKTHISIGLYSLKKIINIVMYIIIILSFTAIVDENKYKKVITTFYKATLLVSTLFVLEFIIGTLHSNLFRDIVNFIFGKGESTYYNIHFKNGMLRMCGLTREPSHFVKNVFISTSIVLFFKKYITNINNHTYNCLIILNLLFLLLSMSMSSLIFLLLITFVFIITKLFKTTRLNKNTISLLIILLLASIGILFFGYYMYKDRILEILKILSYDTPIYNGTNGSEIARLTSIKEAFKVFFSRPVFGGGIGTTDGHSFTAVVLSNVGIVGLVLWMLFIKSNISFKINIRKLILVIGVLVLLIFVGSIADLYSLPMYFVVVGFLTYLQEKIL